MSDNNQDLKKDESSNDCLDEINEIPITLNNLKYETLQFLKKKIKNSRKKS